MTRARAKDERVTADALFGAEPPPEGAALEGRELDSAYWRIRSLRDELERKERYWASVCEALSRSYAEVETMGKELASSHDRMKRELGSRVAVRAETILASLEDRRHAPFRLTDARLRIEEPLGEGASGSVYRAIDEELGAVAVKFLHARASAEATRRFLAEPVASLRVHHPAIVQPWRLDATADGWPFIVMDLVEGESLRSVVSTRGPLPVAIVLRLGAVLLGGLSAAHAEGVVHRDVKPGNIMLTTHPPGVRILDFGIARLTNDHDASLTGSTVGTPAYAAPEQSNAAQEVGPKADVYGAFATLFEAAVGRPPFTGRNLGQLRDAHAHGPIPRLREHLDVHEAIDDLFARGLSKRAELRPSSGDAARELDRWAARLLARSCHEEMLDILVAGSETRTD